MTEEKMPPSPLGGEPKRVHRIWVILIGLCFPTVLTWCYFVALSTTAPWVQQLSYSAGKTVQFVFPAVWVFIWGRRQTTAPHRKGFANLIGLGFGIFIAAAMGFLYIYVLRPAGFFADAAGQVQSKIAGMGLASPQKYFALGLFYSLCHSFLEEYYWRWFVFGELRQVTRLPVSIAVSSVGFMAHHIIVLATFFGWQSPATWLFSIAVGIGGAFWAWLYDRYRVLTAPWISHCLVDAAIFAIGFDLIRETFD